RQTASPQCPATGAPSRAAAPKSKAKRSARFVSNGQASAIPARWSFGPITERARKRTNSPGSVPMGHSRFRRPTNCPFSSDSSEYKVIGEPVTNAVHACYGSTAAVNACPPKVRITAAKQTCVRHQRRSQKCQLQTHALQQRGFEDR